MGVYEETGKGVEGGKEEEGWYVWFLFTTKSK